MIQLKRDLKAAKTEQERLRENDRRRAEYKVEQIMEGLRNMPLDAVRDPRLSVYPLYPLDAPGMPSPGPDFTRVAEQLTPRISDENGETSIDRDVYQRTLRRLLTRALFEPGFTMPVLVKNQPVPVPFIPGHVWEAPEATGPIWTCDVMVVGKMPAEREVSEKRNFAGASGRWFRDALRDCGYRGFLRWYMTNILKFPIPVPSLGNAIAASWLKDCALLLEQELRLVKPKFVLCLGSEAATYFLGSEGKITVSANRVFDREIPLEDGTTHKFKVMTAIHPAAVARATELYEQLLGSVRLFINLVEGKPLGTEEDNYNIEVIRNAEQGLAFAEKLLSLTAKGTIDLSLDTEYHKDRPVDKGAFVRTIQVGYGSNDAAVFVLHDIEGKPVFQPDVSAAVDIVRKLFTETEERKVRLITHFGRSDQPWMKALGFDIAPLMQAPEDTPEIPGFIRLMTEGWWDTSLAAHAINETDEFKLELQCSRYTGMIRWDGELQRWKQTFCAENDLDAEELEGYGPCPDEILIPYGGKDVIGTWRLKQYQAEKLSADNNGQDSWMPFWISARASASWGEIEETGLLLDTERLAQLRLVYQSKKTDLITDIRGQTNWSTFNPASVQQCKELLFGIGYSGSIDKTTGGIKKVSPEGAILCDLKPVKSSSKTTKTSWDQLVASGEASKHSPSTDKEVLGMLSSESPIAKLLRNTRFLTQLLNTTLRPPATNKKDKSIVLLDDDGNPFYEKGLMFHLCADSRIRTNINQLLETGRLASRRPNLQNISKKREADYKDIAGEAYMAPLRSMFVAPPGCVLVEADYQSAELALMAWMSQDAAMLDHVRRNLLGEKHPDFYDIHSQIAVKFFQLDCEPTKDGLKKAGAAHLRTAAKNVIFGYAYGRGAEAIARQCKEESKPGQPDVTVEQAKLLIDGLSELYPGLVGYFQECRNCVLNPGWLRNCFGRVRRFRTPSENDLKTLGELQRQCMNFPIQSGVADAVSRAADHLYQYRLTHSVVYKIAMQIHDAILLEVPIEHLEEVYDVVLPTCMTDMVDVWPCDLDGFTLPGITEPYHLGTEREVFLRWGEPISKEQAAAVGMPLRFAKEGK